MAGNIKTREDSSSLVLKYYNVSPETRSQRARTLEWTYIPDKTKGGFITFPDGTRFRVATSHKKMRSWIEPGAAQSFRGTRKSTVLYPGQPGYVYSSAGGYMADEIFRNTYAFNAVKVGVIDNMIGPPVIPTMMRNEAVTKALNNIADNKANLGENLATFQQTLRLMSDPLGFLIRGIRDVRKRKELLPFLQMSARQIRRNGIASSWASEYLKYVYGFKPLMQDIYGIAELLKEQGKAPLLLRGRGSASQSGQSSPYLGDSVSYDCKTLIGPMDVSSKVRCNLWASVRPDYQGTRALNQLSLLNPASLAWELVPFSFIVDWVLPIGPVLSALTAPAGLAFVDGSISARGSARGPYQHWSYAVDQNYNLSERQVASGTWGYEGYSRERITNWPTPGLWLDLDPFKGDRSFKALALAIIALKA